MSNGGGDHHRGDYGVDSHVGAIMEADDDDGGNGEEVEESGMFQTRFAGHCNSSGCREVCSVSSQEQFCLPLILFSELPCKPYMLCKSSLNKQHILNGGNHNQT